MKEHWIERLKKWVCRKIGHRQGDTWEYNGQHAACLRCRVIYTPKKP